MYKKNTKYKVFFLVSNIIYLYDISMSLYVIYISGIKYLLLISIPLRYLHIHLYIRIHTHTHRCLRDVKGNNWSSMATWNFNTRDDNACRLYQYKKDLWRRSWSDIFNVSLWDEIQQFSYTQFYWRLIVLV